MSELVKEVISNINGCIDRAVIHANDGTSKARVCIVCDHLLTEKETTRITSGALQKASTLLHAKGFANVHNKELIDSYAYTGEGKKEWMQEVLLSPRAHFIKATGSGSRPSFSACDDCKHSLSLKMMPVYAIANKHTYGGKLPHALEALTEIEWALLTPIKEYGFTFTYHGGRQKKLKGVLSFFKVNLESVVKAVLQLEALGLNGHVVVLLTGPMTPKQIEKAKQLSTIRIDYVINAISWLQSNNYNGWRDIDIDKIREKLKNLEPIIVDESTYVEGSDDGPNNNIEETVSFAAYFPDGSMKPVFGGHATIDDFKSLVERSHTRMTDILFQCDLIRERVRDYQDNNFATACLQQMPYGLGGMEEERYNAEGVLTRSLNLTEYVRHLSKISMPRFHRPLFVLILQSICQRQTMLQQAKLRVRGKQLHTNIANNLNAEDIATHAKARKHGHYNGTAVSRQLLDSVDTVTRALPHTDGAATKARTEAESLVQHFGFPSYFLTFAPDDDNSHLLQVFSGVTIDDNTPVSNLTDEELMKRCKQRTELRIQVPGLSAHFFEVALEIVLEQVLAIDLKTMKPSHRKSLLGKVKAALVTIEEQGRTTLHAHILVWVDEIKKVIDSLQDVTTTPTTREKNIKTLQTCIDNVASTELIGTKHRSLNHIFQHSCREKNFCIEGPDLQQLRNLRHKIGGKETEYLFAHCKNCGHCFTHENIVKRYIKHEGPLPQLTSYPEKGVDRLKTTCIEFQKPNSSPINKAIINAAYNTHFSFHTNRCFSKSDPKHATHSYLKRKRNNNIECKARQPDMKRQRTLVKIVVDNASWYSWKGVDVKRHLIEMAPKRAALDELQNVSLPAISESKLTCNSNISLHTIGAIVFYITKYLTKSTQDDDTRDYKRVVETLQRMLADTDSERAHDDDRKEAQRRILRASFAHNSTNVMGAPMATWLTKHGTRFLFTHKFAWCPLKDISNLLINEPVQFTVKRGTAFPENLALHYLCRNATLDTTNVFDFYSLHEVVYITKYNRKDVDQFIATKYFAHPSLSKSQKKAKQGSKLRDDPHLLKLRQWEFHDAADFGANILDPQVNITPAMEHQSRLILILFLPHRCNNDLLLNRSHTEKLRDAWKHGHLKSQALTSLGVTVEEYLQNLQDCRANCTRHKPPEDELTRSTQRYTPVDAMQPDIQADDDSDEDDDDSIVLLPEELDLLLDEMFDSTPHQDANSKPSTLNLKHIQSKTKHPSTDDYITNGGNIPDGPITLHNFIEMDIPNNNSSSTQGSPASNTATKRHIPTKNDIIKTIVTHTTIRHRTEKIFGRTVDVSLPDANGSARSIVSWGRAFELDAQQRKAFEVLASSFALSFFDDAPFHPDHPRTKGAFSSEHQKLKQLSGRQDSDMGLVAFIHGPGGSGKTAVIDLVKLYCEEYCGYLKHPFTVQTIVVTALTGSAATLLLGETTHRALGLNCRELDPAMCDMWIDTRLLVIDEISFASPETMSKIDTNLRALLGKQGRRYGGLDIVFCGDLFQLKAINQDSIIDTPCPHLDQWINCYIELQGLHRFKDDPEWGRLLGRFRNGTQTLDDYITINERIFQKDKTVLPDNIKYATSINAERDVINTAVFEKHCIDSAKVNHGTATDAIMILSDNLLVKSGKSVRPLLNRTLFWEGCGEDNIKVSGKTSERVDPVLKLFHRCEVMLTKNTDVKCAKANGTRAFVQRVRLKRGEEPFLVEVQGIRIPAVFASSVDYVNLVHLNTAARPAEFTVVPRQFTATASVPKSADLAASKKQRHRFSVKVQLQQIPLISNTATTCHKLQGVGVDNLFVVHWKHEGCWIYVVLSRVTTRDGLFLSQELPPNIDLHHIPPQLQKKLDHFRDHCQPPELSSSDYDHILNDPPPSPPNPTNQNNP